MISINIRTLTIVARGDQSGRNLAQVRLSCLGWLSRHNELPHLDGDLSCRPPWDNECDLDSSFHSKSLRRQLESASYR